MNRPRTPEFDRVAKAFGWSGDPSKVGDDAARLANGQFLCCDALAEGVHFRFDWSSPSDVGWKAVAQNVADILAMGAIPTQAVWSVGMGRDWTDSTFRDLAKGAKAACKAYGCEIVGGDTVRTLGAGFVSLSLLGTPGSKKNWTRSGARPGDAIVLVGESGWSAAGLEALSQGRSSEPALRKAVLAHRRPKPPMLDALALMALEVHAAIDLSDGLSSELEHLARASGVAMVVDAGHLAPSSALAKTARLLGKTHPSDWIYHGGEDHCLLLAIAERSAARLPATARRIGLAEEGSGVWLALDGERRKMAPLGWVHA